MFPGSPGPLPPTTPLIALTKVVPSATAAGVWLRGGVTAYRVTLPGARRLTLCHDLGALLRRCDRIVVRHGGRLDLLSASQLVRCRVLEIVLGTPFLPAPAQLRALYPTLAEGSRGYAIPIGLGSAEEALAICAAEHMPVRATRIEYGAVSG